MDSGGDSRIPSPQVTYLYDVRLIFLDPDNEGSARFQIEFPYDALWQGNLALRSRGDFSFYDPSLHWGRPTSIMPLLLPYRNSRTYRSSCHKVGVAGAVRASGGYAQEIAEAFAGHGPLSKGTVVMLPTSPGFWMNGQQVSTSCRGSAPSIGLGRIISHQGTTSKYLCRYI